MSGAVTNEPAPVAEPEDRPEPAAPVRSDPLGIIAGGGALPRLLAEALEKAGRPVHVIALHGFAESWVNNFPHSVARLAQVGHVITGLRRAGCREVCLVGSLARPALFSLLPDLTGLMLAPRFMKLFREGDDGLLRGINAILEERGFVIVGASAYLGDLLAPVGKMGARKPDMVDLADIARAAEIVEGLGALDIGQGAVVARMRVLAVETVQGTDVMLEKLVGDRRRGGAPIPSGVLFKAPKPGQDRRVDMPTIGPQTVSRVREAGLSGIAVAAGEVFVLEPEEVVRAADREGVFVFGWRPDEAVE